MCACYLASFGADLNARDITGNTPLHYCVTYASEADNLDVFKKLLLQGADRHAENGKG